MKNIFSGTKFPTKEEAAKARKWVVVDAADKSVGRLASHVASLLRGKTGADFSPHVDTGPFVIVINASKVKFTGKKGEQKQYFRHTEYFGGIKSESANSLLARKPSEVIRLAVKGMVPKTPLGRAQLSKLKVYAGDKHPHQAQKPEARQ